ncbi:sugar ABC transporter permease [Sporanaerobium hydrogeniformans]|uniref:Sugar ABC transporter permease n=2 Tax=Sporanaerobium hydrogeniformans TaxID=3072179 RepID=A0AC61DBJ0_9FIRM|nr:sugar ABC transporter permease [Sporanaerobium hydrogeniformans]
MEWDSANPMTFVGIDNFLRLFKDKTFQIAFMNTIYYVIGTVPITLMASLGLAMVLNSKIKGRNIFRTVFFFPYVASLIAVVVVWNMLFHPDMGPINSMLSFLGVKNLPKWAASVKWAMPTVILFSVWKYMGYYMVMYLAALQGVPKELYEAGDIDGTTKWQRFRYITLPTLTPTTFFVVIMLTIQAFKVFDIIYAMTDGGPGRSTTVLVSYIYAKAFTEFEFGYASAMSIILFAIVLVITIIQFRTEKKWVSYM